MFSTNKFLYVTARVVVKGGKSDFEFDLAGRKGNCSKFQDGSYAVVLDRIVCAGKNRILKIFLKKKKLHF